MNRQRRCNALAAELGSSALATAPAHLEPDLAARAELAALLSSGPLRRAAEELIADLPEELRDLQVGEYALSDRILFLHDGARLAMARTYLVGLDDGRRGLVPVADLVPEEDWPTLGVSPAAPAPDA